MPRSGIARYLYTMEYYSAIKKNEIVPFADTWMELKTVIQSEVNQREKQISYINAYIRNLKNGIDELICKAGTETQT